MQCLEWPAASVAAETALSPSTASPSSHSSLANLLE